MISTSINGRRPLHDDGLVSVKPSSFAGLRKTDHLGHESSISQRQLNNKHEMALSLRTGMGLKQLRSPPTTTTLKSL